METQKKNSLGIVGCLIGLVALTCAFLSPQIAAWIDPPPKPIEESVANFAVKLKDAAIAKMKGEKYQAEPVEKLPSEHLFTAIIALGMVGVGFGVFSLIRGERKRFAGGAIALGVSAAVVQWSIIFAAVLIVVLLIWVVFDSLGIDLPMP